MLSGIVGSLLGLGGSVVPAVTDYFGKKQDNAFELKKMEKKAQLLKAGYTHEMQMFEQATELGCQVIFSGGAGAKGDGGVSRWQELFERYNSTGRRITSVCHTRPSANRGLLADGDTA